MQRNNNMQQNNMQQNQNSSFTAKEMLDDALSTQKLLTEQYNVWANECVSPSLKGAFMNLLKEEHDMQHDVFCEMQGRGWYQVEPAQPNKINEVKQKFSTTF